MRCQRDASETQQIAHYVRNRKEKMEEGREGGREGGKEGVYVRTSTLPDGQLQAVVGGVHDRVKGGQEARVHQALVAGAL